MTFSLTSEDFLRRLVATISNWFIPELSGTSSSKLPSVSVKTETPLIETSTFSFVLPFTLTDWSLVNRSGFGLFIFNGAYKFRDEVEKDLGVKVIGMIPPMKTPAVSAQMRHASATSFVLSVVSFCVGCVLILVIVWVFGGALLFGEGGWDSVREETR